MTDQRVQLDARETRARAEEARKLAERRDRDRRAWLRARAMTIGANGR